MVVKERCSFQISWLGKVFNRNSVCHCIYFNVLENLCYLNITHSEICLYCKVISYLLLFWINLKGFPFDLRSHRKFFSKPEPNFYIAALPKKGRRKKTNNFLSNQEKSLVALPWGNHHSRKACTQFQIFEH